MVSERVHRIVTYIGYGVMISAVVAVVVCAEMLSRKHRATQPIERLDINVTGGGAHPLADAESIEEWIAGYDLLREGMTLDQVNIGAIERATLEHSAVAEANSHITYNGVITLDVALREPIARLRLEGYDMYVTKDGFLLPTVEGRTMPLMVITGDYAPLFAADYTGFASERANDSIAALNNRIERLEAAKLPYYRQLDANDAELREVVNQSVRKGLFMSKQEHKVLTAALQERKVEARERHNAKRRSIEAEIARLESEQLQTRLDVERVKRANDDFYALLDMLVHIAESNFWQAEVVQVTVVKSNNGAMELGIVPRSGDFVVDLGSPTRLDEKLADLYHFYHNGLDKVGWDKYANISLRYRGQVVCH